MHEVHVGGLKLKNHFLKKINYLGIKGMDVVVILAVFFLGSGILMYNLWSLSRTHNADKYVVSVTQNLKVIDEFDLNTDRIVNIEGYGILSIKSGKVKVLEANCRDRICVHTRAISHEGEAIICLPHKIIIQVVSKE